MAMMMYEQFKNRSGPANPGSKQLPKVCIKFIYIANHLFLLLIRLDREIPDA